MESTIGIVKGDTRNLDYSSYGLCLEVHESPCKNGFRSSVAEFDRSNPAYLSRHANVLVHEEA